MKVINSYSRFIGGIADYNKESLVPDSYAMGRSIDVRTDPQNATLLPRTIKESGSVFTDLPKWFTTIPTTLDTYSYGESGNFYKRTSAGSWSFMRQVPNSHGNGLSFFADDNFVYYTSDKVIGRYGSLASSSPQFVDDFLGSQGGVPLNTNSLDLESGSSQYASRADTVTTSITGNLSIEAQIKPESLPTVGNPMTFVSKWTENGNLRSYKFDMAAVSGYFGDGSDSSRTVSVNTTESPIDSTCTGVSGAQTLSATNASFAAGQVILIHQSQGSNAGSWMRNTITSYTAGTITLGSMLNTDYVSGAQVIVMPQYTTVTVDAGVTWSCKAWDGAVGGILCFIANTSVTVASTATISALGGNGQIAGSTTLASGGVGGGFRGGNGNYASYGTQGEGTIGVGVADRVSNGSGGGGGYVAAPGGLNNSGGGGGGNATTGSNGVSTSGLPGAGGNSSGSADLTTMTFGGGGGGGASLNTASLERGGGGAGGGIIFITSVDLQITGALNANGGAGGGSPGGFSGGGAGAGGSILLKAQTATLNSNITADANNTSTSPLSGTGSAGRIHLDYLTSYTGITSPTIDATQDNTLVTSVTYQLRLALSSNGTNVQTLSQSFIPMIGVWQDVGVAWIASTGVAEFYLNAVSLGARTGAFTSIDNNASTFNIGAYFNGAGTATGFYDGLIDEVRLFSIVRSAAEFSAGVNTQILAPQAGLNAYYKLNGDYTDSSGNTNTLTATGSPVFSSDVPYPSPTTRLDIDQQATTSGHTYTTPLTISEGATDKKTFTPKKDPQKSLAVLVAAKGTGNVTVTVHDQYNNVVTTKTIATAMMSTGYIEFIFDSVWRPPNFLNPYHFHVTSTIADTTLTTGTADDLETVSFRTYYQFLVTDSAFHPISPFLNFLVFGNDRYLATYDATLYEPHRLVFPGGWKVRCLSQWNEYLAIGMWKGQAVTEFDSGRIYFWDGIAPTFNFFIEVPEGAINAMFGYNETLNFFAGYQGDQMVYTGGTSAQKVKRLPLITPQTYTEVFPGAVTMWKTLLRYGVAGNSDSTAINRAIYTWGKSNIRYGNILTCDYPISTGNFTGTNVRIGATATVNTKLLIGWQDGVGFGVDYVSDTNPVYPTGRLEFLIDDSNSIYHEKQLVESVANFLPLLAGQGFDLEYQIDDDGVWQPNADTPIVGDTITRQEVANGRYHQVQTAINFSTSVATSPTLNGQTMVIENHITSERVG